MPVFQFVGRDPLEIAKLEAESRNIAQVNEATARTNALNLEASNRAGLLSLENEMKRNSPEYQLAQAKLQSWGMLSPEEQKETMGVKSPIERQLQEAQLKGAQAAPGLAEREMRVKEEHLNKAVDQFTQQYNLSKQEYQLKKDAYQARRDEFFITNYNTNRQNFIKRLQDLAGNKEEISMNMKAFLMQNMGLLQGQNVSADTAIGVGTDMVYSMIDMMKRSKLQPDQVAQLKQNIQVISNILRERAGEDPTTLGPAYKAYETLVNSALSSVDEGSSGWMSKALGWGAGAAGAGYGINKLRKMNIGKRLGTIFKGGPKGGTMYKGGGMGAGIAGLATNFLPDYDPFGLKAKYPINPWEEE